MNLYETWRAKVAAFDALRPTAHHTAPHSFDCDGHHAGPGQSPTVPEPLTPEQREAGLDMFAAWVAAGKPDSPRPGRSTT